MARKRTGEKGKMENNVTLGKNPIKLFFGAGGFGRGFERDDGGTRGSSAAVVLLNPEMRRGERKFGVGFYFFDETVGGWSYPD